ncbi:MAG TPA: ABC transporter permease [Terriglobia bacterium]|jgi:predicted permease|nr:ABC transporter permease [Terriglobia bacterium]
MSWWSRIANVFRPDRLSREIDEEFQSHIDEAIEQGRDPAEARRALGPALRLREQSRDVRLVVWLDSLRADTVFGWRQLMKKKATSAAAILSLALGIGACTSAFRLIDALLLRPLPVAEPGELYALARQGVDPEGKFDTFDGWAYPDFERMRAAAKGQAQLIALSYSERTDLTYASDQDMEKAYLQYVSGSTFGLFGLRPAAGRLLTESDDLKPHAHPYAVLSYDYWTSRFGRDPKVVGRTFRIGNDLYEIVGVGPARFTGIEPGTMIDVFVPTMMHPGVLKDDWTWMRTLARVKPGVVLEPVRAKLGATSRAFEEERAKGFHGMSQQLIDADLNQRLVFEPAAAGVSDLQNDYRTSLAALAVLVALVLLIACANVANLKTAQAAARAREMALRVSIGAGRGRLVQLVLVESAWLAVLAAAVGGLFAWWSAPVVVGMINPPDNPARLFLPADWRVLTFGLALTVGVMLLFGLAPALRASSVQPASALKGGEDPHARRRLMRGLIAVQTAFCFLVLFVAGLFVATFQRLSNQPTGFSADRVLTLETVAHRPQSPVYWEQVVEHLRAVPGVDTAALASRALLSGWSWNNSIAVNGVPPNGALAYFLSVSPGWTEAMKIPIIDGRDFRPGDTYPGSAIVNETFAREYFKGEDPVGKSFDMVFDEGNSLHFAVVGLVRDACYRNVREPILPQAYYPFRSVDAKGAWVAKTDGTFIVRTSAANPLALASILRREVASAWPEFRVSNIRTQTEINESQTVRERLLGRLAFFFGVVALVLAGVGLYGVLDYSVVQRRREIGIRMALGAQAADVARRVTADVFSMVLAGALAGLALGFASARYIETLLYQVKPTDPAMLALPALTILGAALVSALPPIIRAVRIDPATTLRAE